MASPKAGWAGIALRHFRHPPGDISDVRPHDHVLVVHRSAGVSLEERGDGQVRHAQAAPGHVSVTPAGQPVSRRWHGSSEILLITVGKALVDGACRDLDADPVRLHLVPRLATPDGDLDRLGHLLLSQAAGPAPGNALMIDTLARALALRLVLRHSNIGERRVRARPTLPPRRIARVVDYMCEHLDRRIAVPELAAVAGLSASHVTRAFREALGTTPHAYLIEMRLERARELLMKTDRSVTEIALNCGFEQSQHFAAMFRRRFGTTPSAWSRSR